jgi:phosphoserine phosphatase RsbU/P
LPSQPLERLELLYRISQGFNSTLELDRVLEAVIDEVISATHAERGFLMLLEEDGKLNFRTARGMQRLTIEEKDFIISRGVVERVAHEGIPLLSSNAQRDERLDSRASVRLYGLRSILCVPLRLKERTLGVIYVDNRLQNGVFTQDDLDLTVSISSSAAIAIENARLYQVAVEKGRMQRELQVAQDMQRSLIPTGVPDFPGWTFAACWKPARVVSGDFYDFITLDDGTLAALVADVSDKGLGAAMFMALSRSVLRAVAGLHGSPAQDIAKASHLIWKDSAENMFLTLFYAHIEPHGGGLTYVNAGHNPPLFYHAAEDRLTWLNRTGMAAGVEKDTPYQQHSLHLQAGDFLLLYTDGVTDHETSGKPLGEDGLRAIVEKERRSRADDLVDALQRNLCGTIGENQVDDLTVMVIRKN